MIVKLENNSYEKNNILTQKYKRNSEIGKPTITHSISMRNSIELHEVSNMDIPLTR